MNDNCITGPIFHRQFVLENKCQENAGHTHNYDHATIVIRGRIRVSREHLVDGDWVAGETDEHAAGEVVDIPANVKHTLKALEPNTVYLCVFSHRDFDGLVTQRYVGNQQAYV